MFYSIRKKHVPDSYDAGGVFVCKGFYDRDIVIGYAMVYARGFMMDCSIYHIMLVVYVVAGFVHFVDG